MKAANNSERIDSQFDALQPLLACLLLLISVWVVYGRGVATPLFFDDSGSVTDNETIRSLWPLSRHLDAPPGRPTAGRPLVNFSFALNYYFDRMQPAGYHAVNYMLHACSAVLLFLIVRHILRLSNFAGSATLLAFVSALVWAVHPLNTEAVQYISQRTELMMAAFYLATIYCSLRYWESHGTVWLTLAIVSCLAGMASKESMATAPVVVLLLERALITGSFRQALRKSWPLYLGLCLTWIVLVLLNISSPRSDSAGFHLEVTPIEWWLTQCNVLWMYLKLAIWPWPLVIHYEMPYFNRLGEAWLYVLPTIALVSLTSWALWRNLWIGFVSAAVLLLLSPTLIVPIITEIAAERRMYLPLAFLATAVVVAVSQLRRPIPRFTLAILAACVILILAGVSVRRVGMYQDELALWTDTLIHQPDNFLVHDNLGDALKAKERYAEAAVHYEEAFRLRPARFTSYFSLTSCYVALNRPAEAIATAEKELELARSQKNDALEARIRKWLDDYRSRLPSDVPEKQ